MENNNEKFVMKLNTRSRSNSILPVLLDGVKVWGVIKIKCLRVDLFILFRC